MQFMNPIHDKKIKTKNMTALPNAKPFRPRAPAGSFPEMIFAFGVEQTRKV
jgi:hypothetical protein